MADDLLEDPNQDNMDEDLKQTEDSSEKIPRRFAFLAKVWAGKKKLIIMVLAAVILLLVIAGALLFFFSGSDETDAQKTDPAKVSQEGLTPEQAEIVFEDIVVLEPFERISLSKGSSMGMISLNVSLELTDHRYRKQVYTMQDRLRKIVEAQVREMDWLELRNSQGKIKLKYALLKRMNAMFPKVTIRNIYFTNFLMQ
ncbi:MAG: flagellar basal body-associated FliL family protein [Desulfobacter sp.]|nr:MAG: flagellar basal body-associated FliL family protein [Desulfobacter sp.]